MKEHNQVSVMHGTQEKNVSRGRFLRGLIAPPTKKRGLNDSEKSRMMITDYFIY